MLEGNKSALEKITAGKEDRTVGGGVTFLNRWSRNASGDLPSELKEVRSEACTYLGEGSSR